METHTVALTSSVVAVMVHVLQGLIRFYYLPPSPTILTIQIFGFIGLMIFSIGEHIFCDILEQTTLEELQNGIYAICGILSFLPILMTLFLFWTQSLDQTYIKLGYITIYIINILLGIYIATVDIHNTAKTPESNYCHRTQIGIWIDLFGVHLLGLFLDYKLNSNIYYMTRKIHHKQL